MKWPKEHGTLLLQSVVIRKAREVYTLLTIEQSSNYDTVKELILKANELIREAKDKNLGTEENKIAKLTLNLLEPKSNFLADGALQRK